MTNFLGHYGWNHFYGLLAVLGFLDTKFGKMINTLLTNTTTNDLVQYLMLLLAIFFFARGVYLARYKEPNIAECSEKDNKAINLLRDIGLNRADHECALWSFEGVHYQAAQTNYTWEEWLKDINKGTYSDVELDFFNYGDKHYFLDLVTNKTIMIPTGVQTKTRKVGDDIKKGMVLMLRDSK